MLTHAFVSAPAQGPPWQGQIQNSPSEGAPTPRGHQHTRFSQKVHEIKKILVEGRAGGASLDPSLLVKLSPWRFSQNWPTLYSDIFAVSFLIFVTLIDRKVLSLIYPAMNSSYFSSVMAVFNKGQQLVYTFIPSFMPNMILLKGFHIHVSL